MVAEATTPIARGRGSGGPLLVWLGIQLAALALAALKTPYSIHFPQPEERLALEEMIIAQFAATALLFPWLLRDWRTAAVILITSWPFTLLAGTLSAQMDVWKIASPALLLGGWIVGLSAWLLILRTQRARFIGVAVATGLTLGGPLFWYLRAEFREGSANVNWGRDGRMGPILAGLALCDGNPRLAGPWQFLGGSLLFTLLALLIRYGIWSHLRSISPRKLPD